MSQEILDYIKTQRVGVFAVEMMDGSPHAATVHFASSENPLMFFFKTDRHYKKSEPLFGRPITRASFVIGSSESDMRTLQLDGEARLINKDEEDIFQKTFYGKFPEKSGKPNGDNVVRFVFFPKWWRFTDWTRPEGKLILTSTD